MKKALDIIIILLLTLLIVNIFNNNKGVDKKDGQLLVELTDSSYTIPATVQINIDNKTIEDLKINTCENIKINYAGEEKKFGDNFCRDIVIKSGNKDVIDFSEQFNYFIKTGDYVVKFNLLGKEYIETFEIENKGTFTKLFTALFYAPVYNLMVFLIELFNSSLGWAIIGITIIIRLVLLWPQHKMMVSQKKLQAIQPKIKEIQKKHKGNHQVLGKEVMDLYKKEKVNPMGSCGFLLIQMPILLVLYNIILSIKDPSNYYHIYNFLSSFKISSVEFNFFGLDLLSSGGISGILLGITVASIQYFQIKLSLSNNKNKENNKGVVLEKKKDETGYSQFMPDPEMMNKFMLYGMPGMVGVFTYTLFSGIGIYWGISTLFMLIQQIIVNKILKNK